MSSSRANAARQSHLLHATSMISRFFVGEPIVRSLDGEIGAPLSLASARVCKHVSPPFFARGLLRVRPRPMFDCITRLHHSGHQRLDDQREAIREIIAGTAVEPHLCAALLGDDPKTIVLDLVQPLAAGRQLISLTWEARRDEPGRESTLQHNVDS
jgi:hypothetical protein